MIEIKLTHRQAEALRGMLREYTSGVERRKTLPAGLTALEIADRINTCDRVIEAVGVGLDAHDRRTSE